ncbi:MAG TPA: TlpA disulfide reductase family protein [Planctomycetota bacterium]|nr:TlpA disulfide reductase family protein [Planctomycetota bacterium]
MVLLLGREGCPGTARATQVLDDYAPVKPSGVTVLRVDVPLPGEDYKPPAGWQHPYRRIVDDGRRLAGELEFFFYPTLYVLDRDGELRFAGGCDAERLRGMVGEILAEKPGAPKKSYSLPLVAEGRPAPDFAAADLGGKALGLAALRGERATLLFFSDTTCPFTVAELDNLRKLAETHRSGGVNVAIVSRGAAPAESRPVYEKLAPGVPVVHDADGAIFRAYGLDAVPFYYLLDGQLKVVKRRSFTAAAASGAISAFLGLADEKLRFKPTEAG